MKVALVAAPYDTATFRIGENLGVKYLSASLNRAGVPNDVFEPALLGIDDHALVSDLMAGHYDVIGFSVMFDSALPRTTSLIAALRRSGCSAHITMGGHVPTFNDVGILQQSTGLDSVVRFEGEETLVELVSCLDRNVAWTAIKGLSFRSGEQVAANPPRPLIADLDSIPFPVRDETSRHLGDPHFFVITTRGCPFTCTFCSIPAFYKTPSGLAWRARSVANVLEELNHLRSAWGARTISFLDDEFLVGRNGKKRAVELADEMRLRDMQMTWAFECRADDVSSTLFARLRDGGLRHVFIGVESGVQRVLDMFDKRTTVTQNEAAIEIVRELKISLSVGFIMFDPFVTCAELMENIEFLARFEIGSYKSVTNRVLVYRGTRLEEQLDSEGILLRDGLSLDYCFTDQKIDFVYRTALAELKPFYRLNVEQLRAEYRADNAVAREPANDERTAVAQTGREVNSSLLQEFREIVRFAESAESGDAVATRKFTLNLRERINDCVSFWLVRYSELSGQSERR
ncbi:B12-binding domain-containing radical SAM protein [Lentzea sp. NPDC058450]|uniref:B12-binding domain-containing radical SAM protein n=1 Tax=Lentzea sp. NPDC058450 TaxID=3346505 RepID=UPI0036512488